MFLPGILSKEEFQEYGLSLGGQVFMEKLFWDKLSQSPFVKGYFVMECIVEKRLSWSFQIALQVDTSCALVLLGL